MELVFKNTIYFSQFFCLNFNFFEKNSVFLGFRNFFSYEDVAIFYFFQPLFIGNLG